MQAKTLSAVMGALIAVVGGSALGGDIEAGKSKAVVCTGCHGADGVSVVPNYPNLAGQKEAYLLKALKDYQSGARNDPLMVPVVQGLSDDDIRDLAAYFSSLK